MSTQILVEGKSRYWHIQLKVCMENCEPPLTLEKAKDMDYGQLLAYAGEHQRGDNPKVEQTDAFEEAFKKRQQDMITNINVCMTSPDLLKIWNDYPRLQRDEWFTTAMKERKQFLIDEGHIIIKPKEDVPYHQDNSVPF